MQAIQLTTSCYVIIIFAQHNFGRAGVSLLAASTQQLCPPAGSFYQSCCMPRIFVPLQRRCAHLRRQFGTAYLCDDTQCTQQRLIFQNTLAVSAAPSSSPIVSRRFTCQQCSSATASHSLQSFRGLLLTQPPCGAHRKPSSCSMYCTLQPQSC